MKLLSLCPINQLYVHHKLSIFDSNTASFHPWLKIYALIGRKVLLRAVPVRTSSRAIEVTFVTFDPPYISHMELVLIASESESDDKSLGEVRDSMHNCVVPREDGLSRCFTVTKGDYCLLI